MTPGTITDPRTDRPRPQAAELAAAVAAWQVVPWFRPVVDLRSGDLRAALVQPRWLLPDGTALDAPSFAHLLTDPDLALVVRIATVRQAVWARRRLAPTAPAAFRLVVPLDGDLDDGVSLVAEAAATSRVEPSGLAVAVDEAVVLADPRAREALVRARSLGLSVWLDVPGGPCWPHLVDELPLDAVTVDGDADPAVLSLARRREVPVVAREVRSDDEGTRFRGSGATLGHGPQHGDAQPLDDLERRLRDAGS